MALTLINSQFKTRIHAVSPAYCNTIPRNLSFSPFLQETLFAPPISNSFGMVLWILLSWISQLFQQFLDTYDKVCIVVSAPVQSSSKKLRDNLPLTFFRSHCSEPCTYATITTTNSCFVISTYKRSAPKWFKVSRKKVKIFSTFRLLRRLQKQPRTTAAIRRWYASDLYIGLSIGKKNDWEKRKQ